MALKAKLSTEILNACFLCTGGALFCAAGDLQSADANRRAFAFENDLRLNSRG